MTRLPTPGGDDGNWGSLLNDYLLVGHDSSGNVKNDGVVAAKADDSAVLHKSSNLSDLPSVSTAQTNLGLGTAATKDVGSSSGTVAAGDDTRITGAEQTTNKGAANGYAPLSASKVPVTNLPDSTAATKGIIQLAGDLSGTAASPTVPGLATKASDASVVHLAGTETVTGDKNFTGALTKTGQAVVVTNDSRLSDARTPTAHHASHAPGGTDPIDYSLVNMAGTLASRPAVATANANLYYFATDEAGGTLYRSSGTAWVATAKRGELAYAERTTSLTSQSSTSYGDSGLVLPDFTIASGGRPVMIELYWPLVINGTAAQSCFAAITSSGNTIFQQAQFTSAIAFASGPLMVRVRVTTAGTYSGVKARHRVDGGSGKFGLITDGTGAAYIRAEEV